MAKIMSDTESGSAERPASLPQGRMHKLWHVGFWLKELPFSLVLILTLIGVAYTSFSKQPITGFWELLAPLIALEPQRRAARWREAIDERTRSQLSRGTPPSCVGKSRD